MEDSTTNLTKYQVSTLFYLVVHFNLTAVPYTTNTMTTCHHSKLIFACQLYVSNTLTLTSLNSPEIYPRAHNGEDTADSFILSLHLQFQVHVHANSLDIAIKSHSIIFLSFIRYPNVCPSVLILINAQINLNFTSQYVENASDSDPVVALSINLKSTCTCIHTYTVCGQYSVLTTYGT